ncbi:MAG: hypothetical protein M3R29_00860 [Verrucomicrobiota bacterium]|nr:hypothetical protein [Verrucomicrobiota bacterium]
MITDDPGTPGNGKFEINLAVAFERRSSETAFDAPAIDINYGVGENIQLTLQTAPVILKRRGHGAVGGLGGTEAALKWRFLDEEKFGADVSMFPRVIFNIIDSSIRRGLSEDGMRVQLPFQVAKRFGRVALDFEWGALASTIGRSEWLYGLVGGIELTKSTNLMAELHGTSRMSFDRDVLAVNFGIRQKLTERCILIASLGHQVRVPEEEELALIGYCGLQLLY